MTHLTFSHASKEQAKARIALTGPSGSGKTYTALVVGTELGKRVALIDSDSNRPLVHWGSLPGKPRSISVHAAPTIQDIREAAIEARRLDPEWTIVDTEGSERGAMVFAALRFDLVLTPVAGSQLDLREAIKASNLVGAFGRRAGKPLLHRAILTRIPAAIRPRTLKSVVEQLREAAGLTAAQIRALADRIAHPDDDPD